MDISLILIVSSARGRGKGGGVQGVQGWCLKIQGGVRGGGGGGGHAHWPERVCQVGGEKRYLRGLKFHQG